MKVRSTSFVLRGISIVFISLAFILAAIQLVRYSIQRSDYPPQLTIAGVPVGGLTPQAAMERLLQVYSTPVELQYSSTSIQFDPDQAGFELNLESMLAAADMQRIRASFWRGFWDYLWNSSSASSDVPLVATTSEERLRAYLRDEVSSRYDLPAIPAQPIPGSTDFLPGQPGQVLDIERAVILIEDALRSPTHRTVVLSTRNEAAIRPTLDDLQLFIESVIQSDEFDGIVGLYLLDLQTGEELHFGTNDGTLLPVNPDIAFTAASTIKIPVMVSVFRHANGKPNEASLAMMWEMIHQSNNAATDALMMSINEVRGPLDVTDDMIALGLENTFLGGYFYEGAPLLSSFNTPANSRSDISTDPDWYNQTTPSDMGMLLSDLYQCAEMNSGTFVAIFPSQLDQTACQQMIQLLKDDILVRLIRAGVPEGTVVANKYGYVPGGSGVNNVSDAAIVYTPGGNYVLTIYVFHPLQIVWEYPAPSTRPGVARMFADISRIVYNYFNLPNP